MTQANNHPPPPLALRARGPLACFTRPELKTERVSYPVMTPSAARGILEAVLWKPAIRWRVERIKVLAPIAFTSFRRNEVTDIANGPSSATIEYGGPHAPLLIEDRRQQRNTVALRDVDYVIEARIELTSRAGEGDNLAKFVDMFRRRVEKGQHFHQPYLGCREFAAEIEPVTDDTPAPIEETRDLGIMLWDIKFIPGVPPSGLNVKPVTWRSGSAVVEGYAQPTPFAARLENGVMIVPNDAAQAEATILAAHGLR